MSNNKNILVSAFIAFIVSSIVSFLIVSTYIPVKHVEIGDKVRISYNVYLEDNTLYDSGNLTFRVGQGQVVKGVEKNIIGMYEGERKEFWIEPEDGFGIYNPNLTINIPLIQSITTKIQLDYNTFSAMFNTNPVMGNVYKLPTMVWPVKIVSMDANTIVMDAEIKPGDIFDVNYGTIIVLEKNRSIARIKVIPRKGSNINIPFQNRYIVGVIKSYNETHMVIDLNHPLAGKKLKYIVKIERIYKS